MGFHFDGLTIRGQIIEWKLLVRCRCCSLKLDMLFVFTVLHD